MSKNYNWWEDPANAEEVEKISWWDKPENKSYVKIPVAAIETDGVWVIGSSKLTEKVLGQEFSCFTAQSNTREDAELKFVSIMKIHGQYLYEKELEYQRWVPFRKGSWQVRSTWFSIFGIHFHIRIGKNMKYGWYVPFTRLNISIHNEWRTYREYMRKRKQSQ